MPETIDPASLRLADHIEPGEGIVAGQITAEPMTLTEALNDQSPSLAGRSLFLGMSVSPVLTPAAAEHLDIRAVGGAATNHRLAKSGELKVLPVHLSRIPDHIAGGDIPCDVALVHLARAGKDHFNLSLSADYMPDAIAKARVVIGEVNSRLPVTEGETTVAAADVAIVVPVDRTPVELQPADIDDAARAIGEQIARLIPDRATVELGIGALPDAVMEALAGKRDIGIHSGLIGDRVMDLVEAGVVTNRYKEVDPGLTTTAILYGTHRLYAWAHANARLSVRSVRHTHSPATLAQFSRFYAINSALEVDLTGQVNGEVAGSRSIGQIGGQVDFGRAALYSPGGRGVIALRSTARKGTVSTIVPHLSEGVVTTARSDVDVIVTEYGTAELAGVPIHDRANRLIEIAHPDFRGDLRKAAARLF